MQRIHPHIKTQFRIQLLIKYPMCRWWYANWKMQVQPKVMYLTQIAHIAQKIILRYWSLQIHLMCLNQTTQIFLRTKRITSARASCPQCTSQSSKQAVTMTHLQFLVILDSQWKTSLSTFGLSELPYYM